ncbi:oligosaccharide repeat unit polymerase [Candidatus Woesearchaeota archaeon]|nr:oligosaccharide repeat unit polymerase [Candidatus Woesearchaeota archaeon]
MAGAGAIDPSYLARLAQGMRNTGSAAAPNTGIFSALGGAAKFVGSVASPKAALAAKAAGAAGPVLQGAATGVGFAAGQAAMTPVKGIFGWFADLKPENLASGIVVFTALLYFFDWRTGFDVSRTAWLRMGFGIGGFFILALTTRTITFWRAIIASVHFYSIFGFLNAWNGNFDIGILSSNILLIAFLIGSGFFYVNLQIPGAIKWLPVFMLFETYGLPLIRERALDYVANFGYIQFVAGFLLNRMLFPLPLMYSIFAFYPESRTARKILGALILFYLVASLPQIKAAYVSHAGLTEAEESLKQGVIDSFKSNFKRIVSGEFLRAPIASAQEKLGEAFGFGTAKEQPKMGLQLIPDPNMPKVFNMQEGFYEAAAPSIILTVPNPLPVDDPAKRVIGIVGIDCNEESTASEGLVVEPFSDEDLTMAMSKGKPAAVVGYKRPRTAKCLFDSLEQGTHTVEFDVRYGFEADADLSTAFMSSSKIEALLDAGEDPAEVSKIPPAKAEYDNGPVAITWGPVELVTSPFSLDTVKGSVVNLVIFVAGSGAWDGELAGIEEFTLTLPRGASLKTNDPACSRSKAGSNDRESYFEDLNPENVGGPKTYTVSQKILRNDKTGELRPVGDGVQFSCKMFLPPAVLGGADWVGAQFKAHTKYVFSTKKAASFEVKGCVLGKEKDCNFAVNGQECPGTQVCKEGGVWTDCVDDKPDDGCPKAEGAE